MRWARRHGRTVPLHAMSVSVVGAGISGLSIAHHLLERGLGPVTVYERTGIGSGASGIQPGGVRQQWGTRANCLMAKESYAFYRELGERFDPCGYLFLADERGDAGATRGGARGSARARHSVAAACAARGGGARAGSRAGRRARRGLVRGGWVLRPAAGRGRGVRGEGRRLARSSSPKSARSRATAAAGGSSSRRASSVTTDAVVVAAGAESRALLAPLGFDLPIVEEPRTLFLSEPIRERLLEPLVIAIDRGIAAKQLADGRVLASDLRARRRSHGRARPVAPPNPRAARAAPAGAAVRRVPDRRHRAPTT